MSGTLMKSKGRRARAAEWGSLLMSCPPQRGPEVQILSPPLSPFEDTTEVPAPVAQRIEHLTTDQKVGGSNPFGRTQIKGASVITEAPLLLSSALRLLFDVG